jgi:hypothetical protein
MLPFATLASIDSISTYNGGKQQQQQQQQQHGNPERTMRAPNAKGEF